jgi:hypothetical protein
VARIKRFVSPYGTYYFPQTEQSFTSNFRDVLARAERLPGVDGGLDSFGTGRAPSAIGKLDFGFYLTSTTLEGMQVKRDEAAAMRDWGAGQLYVQPTDPALPERWIYCRINRISDDQRLDQHTDRFQLMQVSMQVTQPYWYTAGTEKLWDDGGKWDDGIGTWDGNASAPAPTSIVNSGTMSITNNGNVFTLARVLVINSSGSPINNVIVRRIRNGEIADEVRYNSTIANGDWLEINSRSQRVLMGLSGADVFADFEYMNADWMQLLPGVNSLQVYVNGTAQVAIRYMERIA